MKSLEDYKELWSSKPYVNNQDKKEAYIFEKAQLRDKERQLGEAALILSSIENLLKSERVREKLGDENVAYLEDAITRREDYIQG